MSLRQGQGACRRPPPRKKKFRRAYYIRESRFLLKPPLHNKITPLPTPLTESVHIVAAAAAAAVGNGYGTVAAAAACRRYRPISYDDDGGGGVIRAFCWGATKPDGPKRHGQAPSYRKTHLYFNTKAHRIYTHCRSLFDFTTTTTAHTATASAIGRPATVRCS